MANTISFGSFFLVFVVVVVVSKFIQTSEDLCSIHLSDSILGSATQIKALFHVVWLHSSGTVWESRWLSWAVCPNKPSVSVDVKNYWTVLRHWSQLIPNMSTDIWGHYASIHHHLSWPVPDRPYGLCGREATLNLNLYFACCNPQTGTWFHHEDCPVTTSLPISSRYRTAVNEHSFDCQWSETSLGYFTCCDRPCCEDCQMKLCQHILCDICTQAV